MVDMLLFILITTIIILIFKLIKIGKKKEYTNNSKEEQTEIQTLKEELPIQGLSQKGVGDFAVQRIQREAAAKPAELEKRKAEMEKQHQAKHVSSGCNTCGLAFGPLASLGNKIGGYHCQSCGISACDRCCYLKAKELNRAGMLCPKCGSDQMIVFSGVPQSTYSMNQSDRNNSNQIVCPSCGSRYLKGLWVVCPRCRR
jgi:hypothetical protein